MVMVNEATSVVWGMPGSAFKLGAAEEQVLLERIAWRLLELVMRFALADHGAFFLSFTPPCILRSMTTNPASRILFTSL